MLLNLIFYGNPLWAWATAAGIALLTLGALAVTKRVGIRRLTALAQKTDTGLDNLVVELLARTNFILLTLAIYAGSTVLTLPPRLLTLISGMAVMAMLIQCGLWLHGLLNWWLERYIRERSSEQGATVTTALTMGFVARVALWLVILLLALDNVGVKITGLIAGMGIGGIALALAVQNILGDLFASLSILFDKPFVVGDFIIVDDLMGTVEHIGLKSTRMRSLFGEQIIFANNDLLGSRIRNYKRMAERRAVFSIGVTYQTSADQLEAIPVMIREIIESHPTVRFDRSHFTKYGDSSLDFETVYFVKYPDYNLFMDVQQAINLAIFRRFAVEGIEFAYPTRTLFVQQEAVGKRG